MGAAHSFVIGILTALKYIKGRKNDNKFVIYSDFKSALQASSSNGLPLQEENINGTESYLVLSNK